MKRRAFTLTELLVLIATGALAGSVLLASLGDAKAKVQAAACTSNLREISLAIRLYTDDNGGYMPPASYGSGAPVGPWPKLLRPYLPLRGTSTANLVFVCPSANYPGFQNTDLGSTYSCTAAMLGHALAGSGLTASQSRKQDQVLTSPTQTPLIVEGKRDPASTTANARSNLPWTPNASADLAQTDPASCTYLDFRHSNSMNIAFVDGSVRNITFAQAKATFTKSLWEGR